MDNKTILKTLRRTQRALHKLIYTHGGYKFNVEANATGSGFYKVEYNIYTEDASEDKDTLATVTLPPKRIFEKRRLRVHLPRLYEPQIHPSRHLSPEQIRLRPDVKQTLKTIAPTLPTLLLKLGQSVTTYYQGNVTDAYNIAGTIIEILEEYINE